MARLYPPTLGNQIPAFYQDEDDNLIIEVPFVNNAAVPLRDIQNFQLRLNTMQNNWTAITAKLDNSVPGLVKKAYENQVATFKVLKEEYQDNNETPESAVWKLNVGQFYRAQLAYVSAQTLAVGYYSQVAITKFSFMPRLTIEGLSTSELNAPKYIYKGIYQQCEIDSEGVKYGDSSEKAYYYRFVLKDSNGNIARDTGKVIHSSDNDDSSYESHDFFECYENIEEDGYTLQYFVETNSNINASSPIYNLKANSNIYTEELSIIAQLNFDNAYVDLFVEKYNSNIKDLAIIRQEENGKSYKICNLKEDENNFKDFNIEQGKEYTYYVMGTYSDIIYKSQSTDRVFIDYEDMFLYDGEKQLKIRFNAGVNSLRLNILENKIDTIGGKYPVFMRNGNVRYKDSSITGLISYLQDEQELFYGFGKDEENYREATNSKKEEIKRSYGEEVRRERIYREKALDWLNDGKVKLFKSPTEGNMLVRVSGTSLSPYNGTSRLVWTFSSSITEIADYNYDEALKYNIYRLGE